MNEAIQIGLRRNGKALQILSLDDTGITLNKETDAWPRGLSFEFDGRTDATTTRMRWMRESKGWPPFQFPLKLSLESGMIVVRGDEADSLPPGDYWFRLSIGDLNVLGGKVPVRVKKDSQTKVLVKVEEDPRYVVVTDEAGWDAEVAKALIQSGQTIDGATVSEWLTADNPRENRKACLLNLMAKLRTLPKGEDETFLSHVKSLFMVNADRLYCEIDAAFHARLQAQSDDPAMPFYAEGKPTSSEHLRLLTRAGTLTDVTGYRLESFRQEGRDSMQVVVAIPPGASGRYFADVDIDLGNPLQDVDGFIVHMGELLRGKTTDHLDLHDKLAKGPTARFLYYTVKRG